jgi:arginyl-tRNA synthetase
LPTYEAKDVGLILKKYEDYHFDRSVVITANEQQEYMAVVLMALKQFLPDLANATTYIPHGMVKLAGGVKMSSRIGNIIRATEVLDITADAIAETGRKADDLVVLGAIRFAFLKSRIGGDLTYDPAESISLEGKSGPYLQYAHARARSILAKAVTRTSPPITNLDTAERSLMRKISEYPDILELSVAELMPHHVCTYLYELAQTFNRFYEGSRVVGDAREQIRLQLVEMYADVLRDGLEILGILAPDRL